MRYFYQLLFYSIEYSTKFHLMIFNKSSKKLAFNLIKNTQLLKLLSYGYTE